MMQKQLYNSYDKFMKDCGQEPLSQDEFFIWWSSKPPMMRQFMSNLYRMGHDAAIEAGFQCPGDHEHKSFVMTSRKVSGLETINQGDGDGDGDGDVDGGDGDGLRY